jgi:hypothetical protein
MAECDCGRTHMVERIGTRCQQCVAVIEPKDDVERLDYFENGLIEVWERLNYLEDVEINYNTITKLDKYRDDTTHIMKLIGNEIDRRKQDEA